MTKIDRANFGSKLGVILASAGSAVGLGNIWRFPYETGNHGGAAFILIYLGCVFLLGSSHFDCRIPDRTPFESKYSGSLSEISSRHSLALGGTHGSPRSFSDSQLLFRSGRMDAGVCV